METDSNAHKPPLRVGFVTTGLYFDPYQEQNLERFERLSEASEGLILAVVYDRAVADHRLGAYRVRALVLPRRLGGYGLLRSCIRAVSYAAFVIGFAIRARLRGKKPLDLLVSSDPFKSGALAMVAGRILGIPYAVELNANYPVAMTIDDGTAAAWFVKLKAKTAMWLMPRVMRGAGAIKLLYEEQIGKFSTPALERKARVFHDLVPLGSFRNEQPAERYLLLLGHPWLLKGADVAINAFLSIAESHPDCHLRVVGYCPNPEAFIDLARGHPRIHFVPSGVPHQEAVRLINGCFALLLPSRTEGMGRVLLEAMAASKPIIGSRVDGIPRVIHHGENGLLFESENSTDCARQIDRLLGDEDFARTLGSKGHADVHSRLSPAAYTRIYLDFMRGAVNPSKPAAPQTTH